MSILPVDAPLHPGFTSTAGVVVMSNAAAGWLITTDKVVVQLFASVTLTV
jgi:hypothetical protein